MNVLRWLIGAVGVATFAVAVGVVVSPTIADSVPLDGVIELLGNDYFFVAAFGVLALVLTLLAIAVRAVHGLDQATPPDPEDVQTAPRLGEAFDDLVSEGFGLRARLLSDEAAAARERLRSTAVTVRMRSANCSRSRAERAVDRGEWTDDPTAAAFLADDRPSPGLTGRARAALRGESWFQHGLRRSAQAIADASGDHGRPATGTADGADEADDGRRRTAAEVPADD